MTKDELTMAVLRKRLDEETAERKRLEVRERELMKSNRRLVNRLNRAPVIELRGTVR